MNLYPQSPGLDASPDRSITGSNVTSFPRSKKAISKLKLSEKLGISESTIDNRLDPSGRWHDPKFPKPIDLGIGGSCKSAPRWLEHRVDEWLDTLEEAAYRR